MAVEVAIGALGRAERPVDIDAEARLAGGWRVAVIAAASWRGRRRRRRGPGATCGLLLARWSSRRRCGRSRRARTSDRSRSRCRRAAARPVALDLAAEGVAGAVGPGEAEHGDEAGRARVSGVVRAGRLEAVLDALHGGGEILVRPGPARRIDAGIAAQRIDAEAGIVGERRQAGGDGRGDRLERGVVLEGRAGLLRLGRPSAPAVTTSRPSGRDQRRRSRAACRDCGWRRPGVSPGFSNPPAAGALKGSPASAARRAGRCRRGRGAISAANSASLNGAPSAVPWISTMPPDAGHDEIGVGLRLAVLGIVEVEHRACRGRCRPRRRRHDRQAPAWSPCRGRASTRCNRGAPPRRR